ncbi:conserved hypothetical protein [Lodderomyces elongisporus NRRL YB-4239]|uniref:EKC/KEOPS complex subunit GON7 n=1 Tax=Lodderomyces elongisporus (strain ATCC 11503 / CBS 2605 / JCM 1781 / NBRC 1676 / NRRL YB-4239) TaxID=379508 RepID=A5DWA3_LODEL|nr:conserved hypothetical protein [Lodderomyces elongisporus NRRL YB-4239]
MPLLIPTAVYSSEASENIAFHPGDGPHSTNGRTTQISDIVLNAGGEDRDRPSEHKDTPLGHLRASLTTLQDQINEFLTDRMKKEKNVMNAKDIERRLLDEAGGDDDDDDGDANDANDEGVGGVGGVGKENEETDRIKRSKSE